MSRWVLFFSFQDWNNNKNNSYLFLQKQLPNIIFTFMLSIYGKVYIEKKLKHRIKNKDIGIFFNK